MNRVVDATIRLLIANDYYADATDTEIAEAVVRSLPGSSRWADHGRSRWTDYDLRRLEERIAQLRGTPAASGSRPRPSGPFWEWFVKTYRAKKALPADEPSQVTVAGAMNNHNEQWLRSHLRKLGILDYRAVHELVETEPERP